MRSPENAERICGLIAQGYTLRQVAREIGIKSAGSITDWVRDDGDFAVQYARAKEAQADHLAEEILEIADDGTNDWVERERDDDGNPVAIPDHEHIQRSRLRVDTRKWLMSKMMPKKYGDLVRHAGADGMGPVTIVTVNYADEPKEG